MELSYIGPRRKVERLTSADPNYRFPDLDFDVMDIVEGRISADTLEWKIQWNHKETDDLGNPKGSGIDTTRQIVEQSIISCRFE
jgi:hypothetical protein